MKQLLYIPILSTLALVPPSLSHATETIQCTRTIKYSYGSERVDVCNLVYSAYKDITMDMPFQIDQEIAKLLPQYKETQIRKKGLKNRYEIQTKTLDSYKQILSTRTNLFGGTKYTKEEVEGILTKLKAGEAKPSDYEFDGSFRVYFSDYKDYFQYWSETKEIENDVNDPKWITLRNEIGLLQLKRELAFKLDDELGIRTEFVKDFYLQSFEQAIEMSKEIRNKEGKPLKTKEDFKALEKEECKKGIGIGCEKNAHPQVRIDKEYGDTKKRYDKIVADEERKDEIQDAKHDHVKKYLDKLTAREWEGKKEKIIKTLEEIS